MARRRVGGGPPRRAVGAPLLLLAAALLAAGAALQDGDEADEDIDLLGDIDDDPLSDPADDPPPPGAVREAAFAAEEAGDGRGPGRGGGEGGAAADAEALLTAELDAELPDADWDADPAPAPRPAPQPGGEEAQRGPAAADSIDAAEDAPEDEGPDPGDLPEGDAAGPAGGPAGSAPPAAAEPAPGGGAGEGGEDGAGAEPPPLHFAEALCGVVVVTFAVNWWLGNRANECLARAYTKTVLKHLQESFSKVGWSDRPPSEGGQGVPVPFLAAPVLYKDGCSHFEVWATGREGCEGCLITLDLRKRQNLFHRVFELFRASDDIATVELFLSGRGSDPFVAAVSTSAERLNALRTAAPDLARYLKGADATPRLARQVPEWRVGKRHVHSALRVVSECAELLRPRLGVFTQPVIAALDAGAAAGVLLMLHISDQMLFRADLAWRETHTYQQEQRERREHAASPQQLAPDGRKGITLTLRLPPVAAQGGQLEHAEEVAVLHRMAFFLIDAVRSCRLPPAARGKLVGERDAAQREEWRSVVAERASKRDRARAEEEAATSAKEDKDRRAAIRKAGPPKPRRDLF
eukprot:TRINITY_DN3606_c0_g1_i1.p1 TRINITY_DN3606_c0_g1~~TRINITY_DN3606_c0_g1_i1.p1  ORF type:complete len:579 (+),score=195.83 TRINITY_DN3606_c0_g1_i1:108-1844(+)